MANTIKLKTGSGSDPSASDLVVGEVAIRTDSGKLFTKKDNGSVAEISGGGGIDDGDKGDITVSNGGDTWTIDNGVVTSAKIADGTIVNADINASAAIAGSKISPSFTNNISTTGNITANSGRLTLSAGATRISFLDTGANPDYMIDSQAGHFQINQNDINTPIFKINSNGHVDINNNLDCGAGIDVTGNISVSGTVDGVDIAARNTLFGGLTSSSGVLTNGVTGTTQGASDNTTKVATTAYVTTAISNLINGAPSALDTLNELAAAMNDDAAFSTTVTNSLATKMPLAGGQFTGNITFSGSQTVDGRDLSVDGSKLDGIESGATADQSASEILTLIKTVDGAGSGLDADTLDGVSSAGLVAVGGDTMTGALRVDISSSVDGILGEAYSGYFGLKHSDQTLNSEYMILSQDTHTFISASSGSNVYIRGGGNSSTNQLIVSTGGVTVGGNSVLTSASSLNASNIGSGTIPAARVPTLNQNTTGSAATLTTARTIAGTSFNGSANIDISYTNLTNKLSVGDGGLTQNNFTNTLKSKLDGIAASATNVTNTNQLTNGAGFITATLTNEQVEDIVGGMVTGNTESGITVTYQDGDGTLDFVVGTLNQNTTGSSASCTGNAATATQLANARTIAGVSFNGTANISLNNNAITNGAGYITSADGGNAATLDGIDSASFARSDASDTMSGDYTFSSSSQDVINLSANSTNDNRGIAINSRTALSADYNDGYLRLNNNQEFANGVYTPLVMRADGGFNVDGTTVINGSAQLIASRLTGSLPAIDGSSLTGISAGATGGGSDEVFYENGQTVTTNYTITNGKNAMAAGPITINSGVTVTVGSGETLTIV